MYLSGGINMKSVVSGLFVSSLLLATAVAQTTANTQSSGAGSSQTSVSASQQGASANTNNSANASNDSSATGKGKSGSAKASGSAANDTGASAAMPETTIPSGVSIPAVLNKGIDSKKAKPGDEVTARTAADVLDKGKVVVPRNTKLIGHVTEAKAKANGESESTLGIVFDKAVFKNGQSVPLQAGIQALAAPAASAASSLNGDDSLGAGGGGGGRAMGSSGGGGGGGLLGGVGSTAGGVANTAGGVAGGATGAVGSTAGNVGSTVGSTAGAVGQVGSTAAGATGSLSSASTGVIGMKGLQLNSASSGDAAGSVITSAGKTVKLDSGSQMVLKVTGSGQAQ
jgi:hypothetical protein